MLGKKKLFLTLIARYLGVVSIIFALALTLFACQDVVKTQSSEKSITAFSFVGYSTIGVISQSGKTIQIELPHGSDLSTLTPVITHTGGSISPEGGVPHDFTSPVTFTVSAADGSSQDYVATVRTAALSTLPKAITSFSLSSPAATGVIVEFSHTIAVSVPYETSVSALSPTVIFTGSALSPASGVSKDFTNPVTYTVTASDGSTQDYVVTVTKSAPGSNADLGGLSVSTGSLAASFDPTNLYPILNLANSVGSITVTASKSDPNASLVISPSQPMSLAVGQNLVDLRVTAQNGTTTKHYQLAIYRFGSEYTSASIGSMKYVPAGTFAYDSSFTNYFAVSAFRISQNDITRSQFTSITGLADPSNASTSTGVGDPVQQVSWYQVIVFCNKLSMAESLTPVYTISSSTNPTSWGAVPTATNATWDAVSVNWAANGYRLPTDAEWLWAAMGATADSRPSTWDEGINRYGYAKAFSGSNGSNPLNDYVWNGFNNYSGGKSHPVGTKLSNELGLNDMSGNVRQWTWNWFGGSLPAGLSTDYRGPASGTSRKFCGESWSYTSTTSPLTFNSGMGPGGSTDTLGFRVVRN